MRVELRKEDVIICWKLRKVIQSNEEKCHGQLGIGQAIEFR
jgi:hypothetical protein